MIVNIPEALNFNKLFLKLKLVHVQLAIDSPHSLLHGVTGTSRGVYLEVVNGCRFVHNMPFEGIKLFGSTTSTKNMAFFPG
jgi:hypothetical protein